MSILVLYVKMKKLKICFSSHDFFLLNIFYYKLLTAGDVCSYLCDLCLIVYGDELFECIM